MKTIMGVLELLLGVQEWIMGVVGLVSGVLQPMMSVLEGIMGVMEPGRSLTGKKSVPLPSFPKNASRALHVFNHWFLACWHSTSSPMGS